MVGGDPGVDDIALTLLTCSQSYKNAVASMFKRTLRQKLWQWRFKLFARIRPLYVLESAYRIREYIRESVSSRPKFWKDSKRTRKTAAPDLLLLRVFLHTRFNYTDSEIMNMPYARANWEYYGWLEQEGAIEFRNPKDEAFFEKVRSEQKKMRDQNGVK